MPKDNPSEQIQELTLLLLLLTSWTEKVGDQEIRRAWKGYDFDVLDQLYEEGLISGSRKANRSMSPKPESPKPWSRRKSI